MRVRDPAPRRLISTLLAVVLAGAAPFAIAQGDVNRSFGERASATVKTAAVTALDSAQALTSAALDLIGIRYKWGGNTPSTGLDCSGLVRYVFQHVTGVTLPRSAKDMSRLGETVALSDLQPGDLVFFNTRRFAYSHVGIYLGDDRFVHAPRRGREVEVATLASSFWQKRFNGARRMAGLLPELLPSIVGEAVASPLPIDTLREIAAAPEAGPPLGGVIPASITEADHSLPAEPFASGERP